MLTTDTLGHASEALKAIIPHEVKDADEQAEEEFVETELSATVYANISDTIRPKKKERRRLLRLRFELRMKMATSITDEDEAKMPNGYCFEGFNNELNIYPYNPQS